MASVFAMLAPGPCSITGEAMVEHEGLETGLWQAPDKRAVTRACSSANDMNGRDSFVYAFLQYLKDRRGIGDGCWQPTAICCLALVK